MMYAYRQTYTKVGFRVLGEGQNEDNYPYFQTTNLIFSRGQDKN